MASNTLPKEFFWRRMHSLMGLWLVLFLIEHLLTNSQASLLLGDNAQGFVHMVNMLHNLPYLQVIEFFLLGFPIVLHAGLGIKYLFTAKMNSSGSKLNQPVLKYGRNRAYTWQRISSWVLLFLLIGHVVKFRVIDYPWSLNQGQTSYYGVKVTVDNGLYTVADRLGATLYDTAAIAREVANFSQEEGKYTTQLAFEYPASSTFDVEKAKALEALQTYQLRADFIQKLRHQTLESSEVLAVTKDFGTATVLTVRDTFKHPLYAGLYTIFVVIACFHAFNGLWTFLITWGIILKFSAQRAATHWTIGLMILISFLGLVAIWGTYLLNLRS